MSKKIYLFVLFFLLFPILASASPLRIENSTGQEILNILVSPKDSKGAEFFMRLDLAPGSSDQVQNPDCTARLRVDTGLEFWIFDPVNLALAQSLAFMGMDEISLDLRDQTGAVAHINGARERLVPGPGDRPVCGLESFHPLMPMKDVCQLLSPETPVDDNGSLLAGLGFAGLVWAARLAPLQNGPMTEDTRLEHLELRRGLSLNDVKKVLETLFARGYVPWQAEFPDNDIDFVGNEKKDPRLMEAIDAFMKANPPASSKSDRVAIIMLAPKQILPALNEGDSPGTDVQLFTLMLKPATQTMIVDVAAYQGGEMHAN